MAGFQVKLSAIETVNLQFFSLRRLAAMLSARALKEALCEWIHFGTRGTFDTGNGEAVIYRLSKLAAQNIGHIDQLPFSIKILLENALRNLDNFEVTEEACARNRQLERRRAAADRNPVQARARRPCRTSPASRRWSIWRRCAARWRASATTRAKINPGVPVDLVIDHSVQVDRFGTTDSIRFNAAKGIRAQPRALRVSALGTERLRQFPRRPARDRHRPSGQPRISGGASSGRRPRTVRPSPTRIRWSARTATRP